jgi:aarF domain-containing kinase
MYPYVSYNILVESFVAGTSISKFIGPWSDYPPSEDEIIVKNAIAVTGLSSFLQMLLWDNFVHADLHPGNIMVRFVDRIGTIRWTGKPCTELCELLKHERLIPQLVYLDTGLVTQLSKRDRQNFTDLFIALVLRGDGRLAGKLLIERSLPELAAKVSQPENFCLQLDSLVRPIFKSALELRSFSLGPTLFRVLDLVRLHHEFGHVICLRGRYWKGARPRCQFNSNVGSCSFAISCC